MKLQKISIIEVINIGKLVHCGDNTPYVLENTYSYCCKENSKGQIFI